MEKTVLKRLWKAFDRTCREVDMRQFNWLLILHILGFMLIILVFLYDLKKFLPMAWILGLILFWEILASNLWEKSKARFIELYMVSVCRFWSRSAMLVLMMIYTDAVNLKTFKGGTVLIALKLLQNLIRQVNGSKLELVG